MCLPESGGEAVRSPTGGASWFFEVLEAHGQLASRASARDSPWGEWRPPALHLQEFLFFFFFFSPLRARACVCVCVLCNLGVLATHGR